MAYTLSVFAAMAVLYIGSLPLVTANDTGLITKEIPFEEYGQSITREDFEHCTPAYLIKERDDVTKQEKWLADAPSAERSGGYWLLRRRTWTKCLLNVVGTPPDLTYDPELSGSHDIYIGLRAVTPSMSLGIKLSSEKDFTIITAPAATETNHFNFEFHWKIAADMTGKKIVLHPVGHKIYLQHLRFVPLLKGTRPMRYATEHVTIAKAAGRHFAFPGVAQLPNGDLAVVCREGKAHVCPFGRIVLIRSRDGGRTWDEPVSIWDTPSDERDPAIVTLSDNRVAVTFNTWNSWMASPALRERYAEQTAIIEREGVRKYPGLKIMFSNDNGHTWGKPTKIPVFSPHGPVVAAAGVLYYVGAKPEYGRIYIAVWRSDDGGKTWTRHGEVAYSATSANGNAQEVYQEPNLAILPDGKWITTIRVEPDGYVQQSFSIDGGVHWTRPRKLKVRGYPQHLLPLKDGRLLMTYGYRFTPMGIRACVSPDGGKTWDIKNEIVIRYEGATRDLGYPYSIQLKDDRVLTVYYYNHHGGDCYIEGAFYRP